MLEKQIEGGKCCNLTFASFIPFTLVKLTTETEVYGFLCEY